jgi:hypothetical protein
MDHLVTILHEKLKKHPHTKNLSNFVDAFRPTELASSGHQFVHRPDDANLVG